MNGGAFGEEAGGQGGPPRDDDATGASPRRHGEGAVSPERQRRGPDEQFTDEATRQLLELALQRETGPFAALLERLDLPDGDAWFNDAIVRICERAEIGAPEFDSTVRGLDALRRLKRFCRSEIEAATLRAADDGLSGGSSGGTSGGPPGGQASAPRAHERHAEALAGYALSVALAQALHGVMISGRPREEWESIFRHFAELVAQPWSSHFHHASGIPDA